MEHWRRAAIACGVGATLLCLSLLLMPFLYSQGRLEMARRRWERHRGAAYTLVVVQRCSCFYAGEYELMVNGGHVVSAQPTGGAGRLAAPRPSPVWFDDLTVEAAFDRAGRALRASWWPGRRRAVRVEYDPKLGYVTLFESGQADVPSLSYVYEARDLKLSAP